MGRRRGLVSALNNLAREAAREQRRREVGARRDAAAQVRRARERARAQKAAAAQTKAERIEQRELEVEELNEELNEQLARLSEILEATLQIDDAIAFSSLKTSETYPAFSPPPALNGAAPRPSPTVVPRGLFLWLPWVARLHAEKVAHATTRDENAVKAWESDERKRLDSLHQARVQHEKAAAEHASQQRSRNEQIDEFEHEYRAGNADAVVAYNALVLERSAYPEPLDCDCELSYYSEAGELAIDYELPTVDCIPNVAEYKFVKSKDSIEEKPRKASQIRSLYQELIVSVCIRTLHEVFEADQRAQIRSVVFNGYLSGVDPATGQDVERCLVSLRARRDTFVGLNLRRIDKLACLEKLGGEISSKPDELVAVPVVTPYGLGEGQIELVEEPASKKRAKRTR